MSGSELVQQGHQERKAVVYVRQSTPQQVITHQESLRLQYALKQRALDLGWRESDILVIDADLGRSGASVEQRQGFKDLVAMATLGEVGIILAVDVTRLSRNCTDWYQLLDVCGFRRCLIADRDGVYDPGTPNGRLLLGLKGQISELELHTIRSRMLAGKINKAQRGELAMRLPVGFIRDELGNVVKDPSVEVQKRIELVFEMFLSLRATPQVVRFFNEKKLLLPRRDYAGDLVWKAPIHNAVIDILKNPAYAGIYVYGRRQPKMSPSSIAKGYYRLAPPAEWKIKLDDKLPAYITKEQHEKIQKMLQDNYAEYLRIQSRGVPRDGKALLQGIVYCGKCGHKMGVQYQRFVTYQCTHHWKTRHLPKCQIISSDAVDPFVIKSFFAVLSPAEIDLYIKAADAQVQENAKLGKAWDQQLQRLRYQVRIAERQFNQVDPDNRLVASELERRWEAALRELKEGETFIAKEREARDIPLLVTQRMRREMEGAGRSMPCLWENAALTDAHRKKLLRSLIEKVVLDRLRPDVVKAKIIWRGGASSILEIPVGTNTFASLSDATEIEHFIVKQSTSGANDHVIAEQLSQQGYHSPKANVFLASTVAAVRRRHGIDSPNALRRIVKVPGWLTPAQLASATGLPRNWLKHCIHEGKIKVPMDREMRCYLFPDTAETRKKIERLKLHEIESLSFEQRKKGK